MILSDISILARVHSPTSEGNKITIDPFQEVALQGASVDLRLGEHIKASFGKVHVIDDISEYILNPGQVCLAHTLEWVEIPSDCVARVEGKSSIGRRFVSVHQTSGWIDPGFKGQITLEIVNHSHDAAFVLSYGMYICQLTFLQLDQPAHRQYRGRYQGDRGAQGAKS